MGSDTSKYRVMKNQSDDSSAFIKSPHETTLALPPVQTVVVVVNSESTSRKLTFIAIVLVIISLLLFGILASFLGPSVDDFTTKKRDNELGLECGIVNPHSYLHQTFLAKIINGAQSIPDTWPWAVAMNIHYPILGWEFSCGGSLIGPRWVLTAAHCLEKPNEAIVLSDTFDLPNSSYFLDPEAFRIIVGAHNLTADIPPSNLINVKRAIPHPDFDRLTYANDIALLELAEEVPRSKHVQYLCWNQDIQLNVGDVVHAIGWGSTSASNGGISDALNEVPIRILSDEKCKSAKFNGTIEFCAGEPTEDSATIRDTCFGDSGGPIMIKHQNKWTAVGVVSFAVNGKCDGDGAYTRLSHYLKWITDTMTN